MHSSIPALLPLCYILTCPSMPPSLLQSHIITTSTESHSNTVRKSHMDRLHHHLYTHTHTHTHTHASRQTLDTVINLTHAESHTKRWRSTHLVLMSLMHTKSTSHTHAHIHTLSDVITVSAESAAQRCETSKRYCLPSIIKSFSGDWTADSFSITHRPLLFPSIMSSVLQKA